MATARLTDYEKSSIASKICHVITRTELNKEFPIKEEDIFNWMQEQMEPRIREAYKMLSEECPALVSTCSSWQAIIKINSDTRRYRVSVSADIPMKDIYVLPTDPHHAEVIEWLEWTDDVDKKSARARRYCERLVYACTSVGQVKRLLPEEVMRFVPGQLLDFSEVERRSRIPASLSLDADEMDNMLHMLTLGSLSPETRKGADVSIQRSDPLADEQ